MTLQKTDVLVWPFGLSKVKQMPQEV